ncbi:hypothetical protein FPV67DRAFT_1449661 [Lyophyllum atratum]|nr:hypothetical protein FPV67DRAFT_1449661 [Lyophyllum atratum]
MPASPGVSVNTSPGIFIDPTKPKPAITRAGIAHSNASELDEDTRQDVDMSTSRPSPSVASEMSPPPLPPPLDTVPPTTLSNRASIASALHLPRHLCPNPNPPPAHTTCVSTSTMKPYTTATNHSRTPPSPSVILSSGFKPLHARPSPSPLTNAQFPTLPYLAPPPTEPPSVKRCSAVVFSQGRMIGMPAGIKDRGRFEARSCFQRCIVDTDWVSRRKAYVTGLRRVGIWERTAGARGDVMVPPSIARAESSGKGRGKGTGTGDDDDDGDVL